MSEEESFSRLSRIGGSVAMEQKMMDAPEEVEMQPQVQKASIKDAKGADVDYKKTTPQGRWISRNLDMRVCNNYVLDPKAKDGPRLPKKPCCCGRAIDKHFPGIPNGHGRWDDRTCTKRIPTSAYGEVAFTGMHNTAKYVRVAHDSSMKSMVRLMFRTWKMPQPRLLISVTGGAKRFYMKPQLKDVFYRGLTKAASTTGAWVVDGGMNAGVMEHVGKAIRQHNDLANSDKKVVTLGIAPWGCVAHRQTLANSYGHLVQYTIKDSGIRSESPIDGNHTHFLMVDNGTAGQYRTEINFRSQLESTISNMKTGGGKGSIHIPIVLLVLEGGPGTLETVYSAVQQGTPAVIVAGSGRAADLLAQAYHVSRETVVEVSDHMGNKIKKSLTIIDPEVEVKLGDLTESILGKKNLQSNVNMVREILQVRNMLTIFEIADEDGKTREIDIAILEALMKVRTNEKIDQLKLALAWNRVDIADESIFADMDAEKQFNQNDLEDTFQTALLEDRTEFCRLILRNGLNIHEFLTIERLMALYNEVLTRNEIAADKLREKCKERTFLLQDVGDLLDDAVGEFYTPLYLRDERYSELPSFEDLANYRPEVGERRGSEASIVPAFVADNDKTAGHFVTLDKNGDEVIVPCFDEPWRELFLWSILQNRQEMAMFFLKEGKDMMAGSLVAALMLKWLADRSRDMEEQKELRANAEEFEKIAIGIMSECYSQDEERGELDLIRKLDTFGETNAITLAVALEQKNFISHPCCQRLLNGIWMGELDNDTSRWRLFMSALCPPLLFPLITYKGQVAYGTQQRKVQEEKRRNALMEREQENALNAMDDLDTVTARKSQRKLRHSAVAPEEDEMEDVEDTRPNFFQKIYYFYDSPVVTFMHNTMSYTGFVLLYSFIMLCSFEPNIRWTEGLLIFWVMTLFMEEMRQLVGKEVSSFGDKLRKYISDPWNILDFSSICVFSIGLILRIIPDEDCFIAGRVILCINLMMYYFRVLHIFSVFKSLGPKLVMIGKMMLDLMAFVVILLVFIVSFGVAQHAILYPNSRLEWGLLYDFIRRPYWQMYGELFLDEIEGGSDDCTFDPDLYLNNTLPRCPTNEATYVDPILLGLYLMIIQVLMLNLLIAIFSSTYDKVEEESDQHWYFQRYQLIHEYWSRPALCPPLIIISLVYLWVKACCRKCGRCTPTNNAFMVDIEDSIQAKQMMTWHNINSFEYFKKKEEEEALAMEGRVKHTQKKVETVHDNMETMQQKFETFSSLEQTTGQSSQPSQLGKRLEFMEQQLIRTTLSLDWVLKNMGGGKGTLPDLPDPLALRKEELKQTAERTRRDQELAQLLLEQQRLLHVKARLSPYPGSSVARTFVHDSKVSWQARLDEYRPVQYTEQGVLGSGTERCDVDLLQMSVEERKIENIPFNKLDEKLGVDRSSVSGAYQVSEGLPQNPVGRTGLQGRGSLWRWGPNHAGDVIVTRWTKDADGKRKKTQGKPVLEFIAVGRSEGKQELAIPGGFTCKHKLETSFFKALFIEECIGGRNRDEEDKGEVPDVVEKIFAQPGETVFKGYVDDPRNTDNAWIETEARNWHDETGELTRELEIKAGQFVSSASWQTMTPDKTYYSSHEVILKKVADKHGAFF